MPMQLSALQVTDAKSTEMEAIMEIPTGNLQKFVDYISSPSSTQPTTFKEFNSTARRIIGHKNSMVFIRNCLSLSVFSHNQKTTSDETLRALTEGLNRYGWDDARLARWKPYSRLTQAVIESPTIALISKIADLSFTHETHLHDFKIITEMRPVFDESRQSIKAFIVYNELIIYFHNSDSEKVLNIALSIEDLDKLRVLVDSAIRKTDVAAAFGKKSIGTETVLYSDNIFDNGDDSSGGGNE